MDRKSSEIKQPAGESVGEPANLFGQLRKRNRRNARIAQLLEDRRKQYRRIDRVMAATREHRIRHGS